MVRLYLCSCGKLGLLWPSQAPICQYCGCADLDWMLLGREQLGEDLRLALARLEAMDEEVN